MSDGLTPTADVFVAVQVMAGWNYSLSVADTDYEVQVLLRSGCNEEVAVCLSQSMLNDPLLWQASSDETAVIQLVRSGVLVGGPTALLVTATPPVVEPDVVSGDDAEDAAVGSDSEEGGTDTLEVGTDAVELGTDVWEVGTDAVELGTDVWEVGTDAVELGTDVWEVGTDAVELGTDVWEVGTGTGTDAGTGTGTGTDAGTGTGTGTDAGAGTGTDAGAGAGTDAGTGTGTDAGTGSDAAAGTDVADDLAFADLGVEPDSGGAEVETQEDAADDTDASADAESDVAHADAEEDLQAPDAAAEDAVDSSGPDGAADSSGPDGIGLQDVAEQADAGAGKARGAADGCSATRSPATAWPAIVLAALMLAMRRRSWHKAARRA